MIEKAVVVVVLVGFSAADSSSRGLAMAGVRVWGIAPGPARLLLRAGRANPSGRRGSGSLLGGGGRGGSVERG